MYKRQPLRNAVRAVADRITSAIVGEPVKKDNLLHSDEFRTLVEEGEASGVIVPTERILIDNMLEASEAQVVDIMTPISSMVSLDVQQPLPDLVAAFQATHHARVPLFEEDVYKRQRLHLPQYPLEHTYRRFCENR